MYLYTPGTQLFLVLVKEDLVLECLSLKIEDKKKSRCIYTYICIIYYICTLQILYHFVINPSPAFRHQARCSQGGAARQQNPPITGPGGAWRIVMLKIENSSCVFFVSLFPLERKTISTQNLSKGGKTLGGTRVHFQPFNLRGRTDFQESIL